MSVAIITGSACGPLGPRAPLPARAKHKISTVVFLYLYEKFIGGGGALRDLIFFTFFGVENATLGKHTYLYL